MSDVSTGTGTWLSARQVRDMKLPGYPNSIGGLRSFLADRPQRTVTVRGGECTQYRIDLSEARQPGSEDAASARVAIEARCVELWARFHAAPDRKKIEAQAAAAALLHFRGLQNDPPKKSYSGRSLRRFNQRVKALGLSERSEDWVAALLDGRHGRPRPRVYSSEVDDIFRGWYLRASRPTAQFSRDETFSLLAPKGLYIPSLKTLAKNTRKDIGWQAITLARHGEKAFDGTYPPQERDRSVFRAGEAYCGDGWRADNLVQSPDGTVARPIIYLFQDLYSGYIVSYRVGFTENSDLIRLAFHDAIRVAIPRDLYIDNGRAGASFLLSGRAASYRFRFKVKPEEPTGIFNLCGSRIHFTIPHRGQSKPIERPNRELADRVSRHPRLEGSWVGANTVDRPENRAPRPAPLDEFLAVVDQEIRAHNERPGRRAKNCAGRSLRETFEQSYVRGPVRKATEAQLALCLLAAEGVVVSKRDGTFQLKGNRFYNVAVAQQAGRKIVVRFDPQNLQSLVYCYDFSGRFLGRASCILPTGFNDSQAAREHARLKRQYLKTHRENLSREKRLNTREVVALMSRESASAELLQSKVVRLFHPPMAPPASTESIEPSADPDWLADSPAERAFQEYLELKRKPSLTEREQRRILIYESSPEYEVRQSLGLVG